MTTTKTPTDATILALLRRERAARTDKTRASVAGRLDALLRLVQGEQGDSAVRQLGARIEALRLGLDEQRLRSLPAGADEPEPEVEAPATLGLSKILGACEEVHAAVRRQHPDVPVVAMTIGTGSDVRQGLTKWGHHAPMRWKRHDGDERVAEIMVSGEGLGRTPEEVLVTLIHEAAHALCLARGVKDTSRQGRYHNRAFVAAAKELGLVAPEQPDAKHGFSACTLGEPAKERYAAELGALGAVLTASRTAEARPEGKGEDKKAEQRVKAECDGGCGRSFRIALSILRQGQILCEDGGRFRAEGDEDDDEDDERACEGHESLEGADMGRSVYCDGSCR